MCSVQKQTQPAVTDERRGARRPGPWGKKGEASPEPEVLLSSPGMALGQAGSKEQGSMPQPEGAGEAANTTGRETAARNDGRLSVHCGQHSLYPSPACGAQ